MYPLKMGSKPQLLDNCIIGSTELTKNELNLNSVSVLVELDPYTTYSPVSSKVELEMCLHRVPTTSDVSSAEMFPYKIYIFSNSNISL